MSNTDKYLVINPLDKTVKFETDTSQMKARMFGNQGVDFGVLEVGMTIMVYEYGLLQGHVASYFSIGTRLYAGNAIVFATDEEGATIGVAGHVINALNQLLKWYDSIAEVEAAIEGREIERPHASVSGEVIWQWPSTKHPFGPAR